MIVSEQEIQEFCNSVVKQFNPEKVILFGSYARGEQRDWSDVDIMVVMPFEGNGIDLSVKMRTSIQHDFPLDLITVRPDELTRRHKEHDPFIGHALGDSRTLYERNH
ncbi:nucleotidyltransferase domain-containing protein [bacterium]|nr:nucleotidyltransferase domain-containing protein [bacterium]